MELHELGKETTDDLELNGVYCRLEVVDFAFYVHCLPLLLEESSQSDGQLRAFLTVDTPQVLCLADQQNGTRMRNRRISKGKVLLNSLLIQVLRKVSVFFKQMQ